MGEDDQLAPGTSFADRPRLDSIINMKNLLVQLAARIDFGQVWMKLTEVIMRKPGDPDDGEAAYPEACT